MAEEFTPEHRIGIRRQDPIGASLHWEAGTGTNNSNLQSEPSEGLESSRIRPANDRETSRNNSFPRTLGEPDSVRAWRPWVLEYEDATLRMWLARHHEELFDEELRGWYTDPALWPRDRSLEMLQEWCSFELHTVVVDIGESPLEDDEFQE